MKLVFLTFFGFISLASASSSPLIQREILDAFVQKGACGGGGFHAGVDKNINLQLDYELKRNPKACVLGLAKSDPLKADQVAFNLLLFERDPTQEIPLLNFINCSVEKDRGTSWQSIPLLAFQTDEKLGAHGSCVFFTLYGGKLVVKYAERLVFLGSEGTFKFEFLGSSKKMNSTIRGETLSFYRYPMRVKMKSRMIGAFYAHNGDFEGNFDFSLFSPEVGTEEKWFNEVLKNLPIGMP